MCPSRLLKALQQFRAVKAERDALAEEIAELCADVASLLVAAAAGLTLVIGLLPTSPYASLFPRVRTDGSKS